MKYVALLRGINVGGANKVSMAELKSWVAALGHSDVVTYINTGNVIFTPRPGTGADDDALAAEIEARITAESGLEIPVLVRSRDELVDAISANPFPDADPAKLVFAFLSAEPDQDTVERWTSIDSGDDEVRAVGTVAYVHCPAGLGRSKLAAWLLSRSGPLGTTRNLRTVRKLVELAT